ncbi:MAG: hypothetical protein HRT99_01790 [Mycoplasmatales bacterium]|nr:hypothetical protein [Mycoplasmatales bacterium]
MIKTQEIIRQISSSTKISIICWILKYPQGVTVSNLVELTGFKRTNISKQINEMKMSGLLNCKNKGRYNYYFISDKLIDEQLKIIKSVVNSFHYIDENKTDHVFYT